MANFNKFVITYLGRAMIAACQASAKTINITYCKTSSHNYYNDDLSVLTELEDIEQRVLVSGKSSSGDTIKLESNLTNQSLALGYDFYTYGIYANSGGDDILLAVGASDTADFIPAGSEAPWQTIIHSFITISNSPNVTINVDLAANATVEYVNDKVDEINETISDINDDISDLDDNKVDKKTTTGQFAYTHDGAGQGEIEVIASLKGSTIPQRDASGNMLAATPVGNHDTYVVNKGSLNRVTEVTVPYTGWTYNSSSQIYQITIPVTNMYSSYVGTKDAVPKITPGNYIQTIEKIKDQFSHILLITSGNGSITVYADEIPSNGGDTYANLILLFYGL